MRAAVLTAALSVAASANAASDAHAVRALLTPYETRMLAESSRLWSRFARDACATRDLAQECSADPTAVRIENGRVILTRFFGLADTNASYGALISDYARALDPATPASAAKTLETAQSALSEIMSMISGWMSGRRSDPGYSYSVSVQIAVSAFGEEFIGFKESSGWNFSKKAYPWWGETTIYLDLARGQPVSAGTAFAADFDRRSREIFTGQNPKFAKWHAEAMSLLSHAAFDDRGLVLLMDRIGVIQAGGDRTTYRLPWSALNALATPYGRRFFDAARATPQRRAPKNATAPATSARQPPSFDCAQARSGVEKTICASAQLSSLDAVLAERYRTARRHEPDVRADQRAWLRARDRICGPLADDGPRFDCLAGLYLDRFRTIAVWVAIP